MRRLAYVLPLAFVPAYLACGGGNGNLPPPPPAPNPLPTASTEPVASANAAPSDDAGPPPAPKMPDVELTLGAAAPDPSEKPSVKFVAPAKDQIVSEAKAADFDVKLDVKNWKTAAGDAHIHLILDNAPYKRIDDPKAPVKLRDLPGGDHLSEGEHVLIAFPSRGSHESVKTPGAVAVLPFYVGKKPAKNPIDVTKPVLIYSRPKGEYKGEQANHVLVDFQLENVTLAEGKDHVHVTVTGPGISGTKEADAVKFGPPFYLDNLQNGTYVVRLELLGADGKPIAAAYNPTERKITIDHDAPAEPMHHAAPPPASSADAGH